MAAGEGVIDGYLSRASAPQGMAPRCVVVVGDQLPNAYGFKSDQT